MLKNERHEIILDLIHQQHNVKVSELKQLFEVSDETVRRDLAELEKKGLLRVVHGGAVYDSPTTNEYHIEMRIKNNRREKEALCAEAAKLVSDGESLSIVSSTTAWPLGSFLVRKNHLTVVTNSILLANQIAKNDTNTVILTGGTLWIKDQKMMGAMTQRAFREYNTDKIFFSVAGVSFERGITDYNEPESELTKAVLDTAHQKILLTDYSKMNVTAFRRIAGLDAIDTVVSDWNLTTADKKKFEERDIRVYKAARE